MNQETITKVSDAMKKLTDAVSDLNALYEAYPELNDLQPASMEKVIPMSLDEWENELSVAREDWVFKLRTPLRRYLARAIGSTAGQAFAEEVESHPDKWTPTDVINWFVNRRAAFVPDPDQANAIAGIING